MKLCIPTDSDRGMDADVAGHFGSAPFFTMVDLGSDQVDVVRNPECGRGSGDCHHVRILSAHHVQTLACVGIGRHALEAVELAGIRVISPGRHSVAEIVEAVRSGDVKPLTIARACGGHHEHHGEGGHGRHRHRHQHRHGQETR